MQNHFDGAGDGGPNMLLQPATRGRTSGKEEAPCKRDPGLKCVEEMQRDCVSPKEHQLMLFSLSSDKDVVCEGPGNAADRQHGFSPRDQHECNEGHRNGATLGDAHGMPMRFAEHASNRVMIDNIQMKGAVCMPELGWETTLDKNFAQKDP